MVVRTPHAISSMVRSDIRHLATALRPVPELTDPAWHAGGLGRGNLGACLIIVPLLNGKTLFSRPGIPPLSGEGDAGIDLHPQVTGII